MNTKGREPRSLLTTPSVFESESINNAKATRYNT